jgi:hypothetical protein
MVRLPIIKLVAGFSVPTKEGLIYVVVVFTVKVFAN